MLFPSICKLVDIRTFNLYKIYSLPTPHDGNSHLYSYIEPSKPFLLISSSKTQYSMLNNLEHCQEHTPANWLCEEMTVIKRTTNANCEVRLLFDATQRIPDTCIVKTLYADLRIWHKVQPNQWLYILSQPTTVNIICRKTDDKEDTLNNIGFLHLPDDCKAYTDNTILEPITIAGTTNLTNKIPSLQISEDNCCLKLDENITLEHIKLNPVQFHGLNLDELQFAQHRLDDIDRTIQQQLNQPFIVKHSNWFLTTISFIGASLSLFLIYKTLRWICFFSRLWKFISCQKRDRQLAITEPKCAPCVQVFSNCFNKPETERQEFETNYDSELRRLNFPTQSPGLRRSTRSRKSADSKADDFIKVTHK